MRRAYIEIHIAVILFGFTAILGKVITLHSIPLVWWRTLLASAGMLLFFNVFQAIRDIPRRHILQYLGIGCIVAVHWITFFWSIKLANASVALVTFATQSFFTAFTEPVLTGTGVRKYQVLLGLAILPAMLLIVTGLDLSMRAGVWIGLLSAFLMAVFSSLNKRLINTASPIRISFFQLFGACLFITVASPFLGSIFEIPGIVPAGSDVLYIALLAFVCTTLAYVLAMRSLVHLTAFASNFTINLEPVYGIILAWVLFRENEELTPGFYIGGAIILASVLAYPIINKRMNPTAAGNA